VLNFDFEWVSSEVHCELETKPVSNFLELTSSDVTIFIFRQLSENFPDSSTIMKNKKQ